jgi:hypothetical protein
VPTFLVDEIHVAGFRVNERILRSDKASITQGKGISTILLIAIVESAR